MKELHVFDFDGTITRCDTLIDFILTSCGWGRTVLGLLLHSPLIVMMKLHLYDNGKAKQRLFSYFFGGWKVQDFEAAAQRYARKTGDIVRPKAQAHIAKLLERGCKVVVVSASIDTWVKPVCASLCGESASEITVIGTQAEAKEGVLTGRFSSPNCYGSEKVRRLEALSPDRKDYKITAYGDSRGDKQLLEYADESHFRPFE